MNPLDIINKEIGEVIPIEYLGTKHTIQKNRKRYRHIYLCKCSCGNYKNIDRVSLLNSNTRSCGCIVNKSRRRGLDSVYTALYHQIRANALRRNHKFLINKEECIKLVKQECHYCNHIGRAAFKYRKKNIDLEVKYNGLDRIDSKKEYTLDNIVSCCYICNRAKMDLSYTEFKDYIKELNNVCK